MAEPVDKLQLTLSMGAQIKLHFSSMVSISIAMSAVSISVAMEPKQENSVNSPTHLAYRALYSITVLV